MVDALRPVVAVLAMVLCWLGVGCGSNSPGSSVSATPQTIQVRVDESALHRARLEAAKQFGVAPLETELVELRAAGWDGCFGVITAGKACPALFVGGYVGIFRAGEHELRYHLVGSRVLGPVDPAQASDGSPVPPYLRTDFVQVLSGYAREDIALRTKVDVASVGVLAIVPASYPEFCRDADTVVCSDRDASFVQLSSNGTDTYVRVSPKDGVSQLGRVPAAFASQPGRDLVALEAEMRQDLAQRLRSDVSAILMVSYHDVTWPNGCVGIEQAGRVCAQVTVPGFLALLSDAGGKVYRYHGADGEFVAASFEVGARLTEPLEGQ